MYDQTSPLAQAQVNLFANSYRPTPTQIISLVEMLEAVRTGAYQQQVTFVRQLHARGLTTAYRRAKANLHAVTLLGTFAPTRAIAHLQQHTGIALGDLDHLPNVAAAKQAIRGDPRTAFAFDSASATGLKVGVHVPIVTDDTAYKHAWQTVATEYERLYGGTWDPSGKDISRLCYVSYDPDLYVNFEAELFNVPPAPNPEPLPRPQARAFIEPLHHDRHDYGQRAIRTAVQMIQSAPLGTRHHARLRAARLLGGYVAGGLLTEEQAYAALAQALVGYTDDLEPALKTVEDGLTYGQGHPITLGELEAERWDWLAQHQRHAAQDGECPSPAGATNGNNPWVQRWQHRQRAYEERLRLPAREVFHE